MDQTPRLILMPSGRQGAVERGSTVLEAARSLGVEIEAICGGHQTCGKCMVVPESGTFAKHGIVSDYAHLTPPTEAERAYAAAHHVDINQKRMSCVACVVGDILVTVPEESQAHKQVIRKEASDMLIELAPAVRLYYVQVAPATLGGPGDWQRLRTALGEQWGLTDLTIDPLLLRTLQKAMREGKWAVTVTIWQSQQVIGIEPGYVERLYGLAVDVGSTTIVAHLCDLLTGRVAATESMMNPQVRFGEDVLSRISYAMSQPQGLNRLNRAVIRALNDLAETACEKAGIMPAAITDIVMVGNTIMHHILLGIDPSEIGTAPFAMATHDAVDIKARDVGLRVVHPCAIVHTLPCIAGYVGADSVGVLLAELPQLDDEITLIVDIGTNAEILLGTRDWMLAASSPTGPAFEGAHIRHGQRAAAGAIERVRIDTQTGQVTYKVIGDARWSHELPPDEFLRPTGICGSGIIEGVAELFTAGLLDKSGRFVADGAERNSRIRIEGSHAEFVLATAAESSAGQEIVITSGDIRAIQLAKAALYAGVKLMLDHRGISQVDRIKLAGAFGSYIDPKHAMIIGLIPDCDLNCVSAVGNAAGDGARIALLNAAQRADAQRAARQAEYVETAAQLVFQDEFVDALFFPHGTDPFPHLDTVFAQGD